VAALEEASGVAFDSVVRVLPIPREWRIHPWRRGARIVRLAP
jgi:hypothetical protein